MYENSSTTIGLKCGWHGISKQTSDHIDYQQTKSEEDGESIILSGPYGDDVAFIKETHDQILIGKFKYLILNRRNYFKNI